MNIFRELINKLRKQWKTIRQAEWIAISVLSKYWTPNKMNREWKIRSSMTSDERKIERYAKQTWKDPNKYYIVNWKVRLKPLYKK